MDSLRFLQNFTIYPASSPQVGLHPARGSLWILDNAVMNSVYEHDAIYTYIWVNYHISLTIYNVNPGLINPKRLFNWGDPI